MKINWLWDTRLNETRVKKILKDQNDPRFYIYAEKLFSRVSDPKIAFEFMPKKVFYIAWPLIKERVQKDAWAREKSNIWQSIYDKSLVSPAFDLSMERLSVAQQIKDIRLQMGYTQAEMAKRLGVIQQFISKMETGRENLTVDTLKRIAEVLDKKLTIQLS